MWTKLKDELIDIRDKFVPKSVPAKNRSKWVTKKVTRLRKAKTKAWNNYVKSWKDPKLYEKYKTKLRESVKENKKAKQNFEKKLAENIKTNSKSFYSYVSSKRRTKAKIGPLKNKTGKIVTDDKETAEILNEYFASVFTVEDVNYIPNAKKFFMGDLVVDGLNSFNITEDLVLKKLSELNISKTPGPDSLHPKMIYELRSELSKPLTTLFNLSLDSGVVPQDWKEAVVAPLFKKGSKKNRRTVDL